jgi:hypothetical protein
LGGRKGLLTIAGRSSRAYPVRGEHNARLVGVGLGVAGGALVALGTGVLVAAGEAVCVGGKAVAGNAVTAGAGLQPAKKAPISSRGRVTRQESIYSQLYLKTLKEFLGSFGVAVVAVKWLCSNHLTATTLNPRDPLLWKVLIASLIAIDRLALV